MNLEVISKYPLTNGHPTPLLFVHGMLHGAWCWDVHFLDYFASHGFAAHAVNLRGHGKSEGREGLRWARIREYVDDVAATVRRLPTPPILIGHSMGGFVVQKYLEEQHSPGAVLLSSPPPDGLLRAALRIARQRPLAFVKINLTLSLLPMIATPQLARDAFFSEDLPEEELHTYWRLMQDGSYMAFLDMVARDLPKPDRVRTPLLILGVTRDNMLSRTEVEATARAYRTRSEMIPGLAHDSMLELRWQTVAERILAWAQEREPSGVESTAMRRQSGIVRPGEAAASM